MEKGPLLVTCGLPYTNGPCHIGHLRTYVPADFYVRFLRRAGENVVFVCGSDNHGTPIVVLAEELGVTPADLSLRYHAHFDETFRRMGILFDHFGMTESETNHKRTRSIVRSLQENGYLYSQVIQQSYCPECTRSLPDRYVEGLCPHCGALARGDECDQGCGRHLEPGEIRKPKCRVCGTEAELREQEHYFFRLSAFRDFLLAYLPDLAGTSNARNYAIGWVKDELHDWCITRTLEWGVPFPGREDLVVYVWVDAPIGYIAFTEEWAAKTGGDWQRFWCRDGGVVHFIGSDIIYHHCIFWPAMLKGAGYQPPSAVVASGMVKIDDQKFSKSRGYVVWTGEDYLDLGLDPDYLRYYLLSYTSHTKELNFSWQGFAERVNNELVSTLGNFLYRSLYFTKQFFGTVPDAPVDPEVLARIGQALDEVERAVRNFESKGAVDGIMALAAYGNTYIQNQAPWKLVKTDREAAAGVIRNCLQVVHALALLMEPVMPGAAERAWRMLGHADPVTAHGIREGLEPVKTGLLPDPAPLFAKMEPDQVKALDEVLKKRVKEAKMREQERTGISIEEFSKLDIRTAKVLSAEPVKGAKKLVRLQVDIGDGTRQVIAGIAEFHPVETLVGKDIVVVVNLKPATIFGLESQAMLLAAGERASLLTPLQPVPPGTRIR